MRTVPVFAGLGSDVLFSNATSAQALSDSRSPISQILLHSFHEIFIQEISRTSIASLVGINLDDFADPIRILNPLPKYHDYPVVQHATLCAVQLLKYQQEYNTTKDRSEANHAAVVGFCAGLLAAVAVGSSRNSLEYLSRASECFRAALIIGVASEQVRRSFQPVRSSLPWSVVVSNIGVAEASELIQSFNNSSGSTRLPIYISSINSASCVTISGIGADLRQFINTALAADHRVRATNVYSLYHNSEHLQQFRDAVSAEFQERGLPFAKTQDLTVPLVSTIDGSFYYGDSRPDSSLLGDVLDMIFLAPTDWVAVQEKIISLVDVSAQHSTPVLSVLNFGPGYGALNGRRDCTAIEVIDKSGSHGDFPCDDDIAIVGVGIDLPGAADLNTLWRNLVAGLNSCTKIPSDRFHVEDYLTGTDGEKPLNSRRSMGTKYGNFLDDAFLFDNELFGISPREAPSIDPQQRILLQTTYRALENAGYTPDSTPSFSRESFGCFMGNATLDYVDNLRDNIDVYYSPGTLRAFLSGRISYAFKWTGPSMTIDTACSSSLASVHQACQSIINGDCRAAVAGGVNIISSPEMYLGLDKAHFLSPTGQCKAFDQSADGYCRSEGCAVFVLKKLGDALAENDRVLGVIKGIAVNQSGQSSSITHPHAPTQESLFGKLFKESRLSPLDVTVVEAHGTGTQAGDPTELRGIRNFLCKGRSRDNPLHVTSIKSNIGHCEAASGGASLAKLLLMLRHKRIPGQAFLNKLNPAIGDLKPDNVVISKETREWAPKLHGRRLALLNNFGAAGSNVAMLLQEPEADGRNAQLNDKLTYVFGCSARSPELLEQIRANMLAYLSGKGADVPIADICYTSTARSKAQRYRIALTTTSISDLKSNLKDAPMAEAPEFPRSNVFLFSGQGSQHMGMGRDLMDLLPRFRSIVMQCHALLFQWRLPSCLNVINADRVNNGAATDPNLIQAYQTAVFALEVALARSLVEIGVRPSIVTGHSLGEYAALVVAGVLTLESGLWLVAQRAKLIVENCQLWQSSMIAVNMGSSQARQELLSQDRFSDLRIACENSAESCVIGGNKTVVDELRAHIVQKYSKPCSILAVPVAYHTSHMDPVLPQFLAVASAIEIHAPAIAIASNVFGRVIQPGEDCITAQYFVDHCRQMVSFESGINDSLALDANLSHARWLEIGPHPVLLPMIRPRLAKTAAEIVSTLRKDRPACDTLSEVLCAIYKDDNNTIKWRNVFEGLPSKPRVVDLPLAPMIRTRYHVPLTRERREARQVPSCESTPKTPFTVLGHPIQTNDGSFVFQTSIQDLAPLISGHKVCGKALCPASVYAEIALAAITLTEGSASERREYKLSDAVFSRPLLFTLESTEHIKTVLRPSPSGTNQWTYEISSSKSTSNAASKVHCSGQIKARSTAKSGTKRHIIEQALARRRAVFLTGDYQSFSTNVMYNRIFNRVVDYDSTYHAVRKLQMDDDAKEIYAVCRLPEDKPDFKYASQPILLDTMLHVAGFAANLSVDGEDVCICSKVTSTQVYRKTFEPRQTFEVHCCNFTLSATPGTVIADAHAVDEQGIIAVMKGMQFQTHKLAKIQAGFEFASRKLPQAVECLNRPALHSGTRTPDSEATVVMPDQMQQIYASSSKASTAAPSPVLSILSETTGVKTDSMSPRSDLAALGVDSLMIFEIQEKLEQVLGAKFENCELLNCRTVGDLETLCSSRTSAATTPSLRAKDQHHLEFDDMIMPGPTEFSHKEPDVAEIRIDSPLASSDDDDVPGEMIELLRRRLQIRDYPEHIQQSGVNDAATPIYLIHPGAGMCHEYRRIATLSRDVYSISDPRIFSSSQQDWASIHDMANHYANMILQHRASSTADIMIGGYSFGGIVAFEVAQILNQYDARRVRGVVLIDAPPPTGHIPIAKETIDEAMNAKHSPSSGSPRPNHVVEFEAAIGALAIRNNLRRAILLGRYQPLPTRVPEPRVVLLRSSRGFPSRRGNGSQTTRLPRNPWLHDRRNVATCVDAWNELTGREVPVIDIPGDHFTPFEPENVAGTSEAMQAACAIVDGWMHAR